MLMLTAKCYFFMLQLLQNCQVTGIQTYVDDHGTKRVKAVETNKGTINTKVVVNAAGRECCDMDIMYSYGHMPSDIYY